MGHYSKWNDRCSSCKKLYSLGSECVIITLILIHVLSSALELLIHFEVVQVPGGGTISAQPATSPPATPSTTDTSNTHDPGGSKCDPSPHDDKLILAVDILRYACVIISTLFIVEMVCKIVYLRKNFFRDLWQVFDLIVVICSLAVEIGFFVRHDSLLCVHTATEVATFIIVLRLWRIPRACSIRKEEYSARLDSHIEHLTKTKIETDSRCKHMEVLYQHQEQEIKQLKTLLKDANLLTVDETVHSESIVNGRGLSQSVINKVFDVNKTNSVDQTDSVIPHSNGHVDNKGDNSHLTVVDKVNKRNTDTHGGHNNNNNNTNGEGHTDLERNDSDVNSKANDSGIEVKDSFRSDATGNSAASVKVTANNVDEVFYDSDTETNGTQEASVQEVQVQIEEPSRQAQLPSITSYRSCEDSEEKVMLREKKQTKLGGPHDYVNEAYDADDDMDGSMTYKSADGIPTTEL